MHFSNYLGSSLFLLILLLLSDISFACSPVAKIIYHSRSDIKLVTVVRSNSIDSSLIQDDLLCSGDIVKLKKNGRVTVKYMTKDLLETELKGETELPVYGIKVNTKLSNLRGIVADLGKWFRHEGTDSTVGMMTRTGLESSKSVIRSPLTRGESIDSPFMLKSDLENLHFFWRGGLSPWQASILRNDGIKILSKLVDIPLVVFNINSLEKKYDYNLLITSSDGKLFQKKLVFSNIELADYSSDPLKMVVDLVYLDSEDNWRLQLWSFLHDQSNSFIKSTVMDHLEKDDL